MANLIYIHSRKTAGKSVMKFFHDIGYHLEMVSSLKRIKGECITFGTVRNPYDRAISGWQYCGKTKFRPLSDALKNPPQKDDQPLEYWLGRGHDYRHFTKTQTQSYVYGNKTVDRIIRVESLQEDLEKLCAEFEIETKDVKVDVLNASPKIVYPLSYYEKELIYEMFKDDFVNYGYEK